MTETCSDGAGGRLTLATRQPAKSCTTHQATSNANQTKVNGLEFDSRYKFKLGDFGSLNTELNWTHLMSYVLTADYDGTGVKSYQLAGHPRSCKTIGGNYR